MHMQTAITVMKMKIIVLSGMKMVLRLLPDQILSSLWHLRESEIEGMRQKIDLVRRRGEKKKRERERGRWEEGGKREIYSIDIIVKYIQSQPEKCSKTCRSVSTWLTTLIPLHPSRITFIAGVLVHKVFHGWDLTASDAKNPSSNAI